MSTELKQPVLTYDGYIGQVEFDGEAKTFFGKAIGIRDAITFQGKSVDELEQSFHEAVDAYRNLSQKRGKEPEKSFSGKIPFRTTAEIHQSIYKAAQLEKKSVNAWMNTTLAEAAQKILADAEQVPSVTSATVQEQVASTSASLEEVLSQERKILETLQQSLAGSQEAATPVTIPVSLPLSTIIRGIVGEYPLHPVNVLNLSQIEDLVRRIVYQVSPYWYGSVSGIPPVPSGQGFAQSVQQPQPFHSVHRGQMPSQQGQTQQQVPPVQGPPNAHVNLDIP